MEEQEQRTPFRDVKRQRWLHEAKRLWLLLPGTIAIVLVLLARNDPDACEQIFSRGIYPWLSSGIAFLSGFVAISIAQWAIVLAIIVFVALALRYLLRIIKRRGQRLLNLYRMAMTFVGIASFALLFFTLLCGLNYYRCTFAENAGLEVKESTTEELSALCSTLADKLNESREEIGADLEGYVTEHGGFQGYAARSVLELETLAKQYPTLNKPCYSPPKPVTFFADLMSDADITGIYFAYTVESNINVQPPFYTIPATMLHELAHQSGFMREDEANFIAYLACAQSGDPLIRYSGYSLAYSYAINALAQVDMEAAREIHEKLSEDALADRQESASFWAAHDSGFRTLAQQANDAYLKANDQQDGTQSYGRIVDLLLAERRSSQ